MNKTDIERLKRILHNMKTRCNNPNANNYKYYGGKGIKICDEWCDKEFGFGRFLTWAYFNGYKSDLTIDRIDVNGDYEPSNCRWSDMRLQNNNSTRNKYILYNGEKKTIAQWANELGKSRQVLSNRIKRGWSIERALFT